MADAVAISIAFLLLILAAVISLADCALGAMGRIDAHRLAQEKEGRAALLVRMVEAPGPYRSALLLLRAAGQVGAGAVTAVVAAAHTDGVGQAAIIAIIVLLVLVVTELIPRTVAIQHGERAALVLAGPVFALGQVLRPLTKLLTLASNAAMVLLPGRALPKGPFVTPEEARNLAEETDDDGEEDEEDEAERELISSIFEFGDTVVREVMVPRTDMVTVSSDVTLDEALEIIVNAGYSRIPVYEGDTDNIIGVLYAKDLLKRLHETDGSARVATLGRAPLFVPEQKKVAELLREMQSQRIHMAIVVDEYGGTAGLVTIEDLIEEIVGEIVDEYDQEEPLVEPIDDVTIRVDAKMPIDEVNELLGSDLPHEEWDTVGGLVFGLTGRVPQAGERVRYDSLEFVTERVAGRRIQKVIIKRVDAPPEEEQPG